MRYRRFTPGLGLALLLAAACSSTETTEGTSAEAVAKFKQAIEQDYKIDRNLDAAIEKLEEAIRLEPTYTLCRRDLARLLMERGLNSVTRTLYNRRSVEELTQKLDSNTRPDDEREIRRQIDGLKEQTRQVEESLRNDLNQSLKHFTVCRREWPQDPTIPFYMGHVCAGLERYEDAREHYTESLELGNTDDHGRKVIREAIEALDTAINQREQLADK